MNKPALHASFYLASLLSLAGACASSVRPAASEPGAPVATVHTVTASPAGILVNAYLVEGPHGVVAVDSALTVSDARVLRAALDALAKPLLAVLLTHGHPDHYNGVGVLVADKHDVPIYATAAVDEVIRSQDAAKQAQWQPMFGAEWPERRTFPTHIVRDGQSLVLDGLEFTVHAVGPGESHADSYWLLAGDQPKVFLGDIVLHGEHAFVSDGHTGAWLRTLSSLQGELPESSTLYPGHGVAGGRELLAWQIGYLENYRHQVATLRDGSVLSAENKVQLTADMQARYPEAGLTFLIALGADAVAKELAEEGGK